MNEISVAAILWDIYDDDVDSSLSDTISLGYANFWKVLVKENSQNQKSKTFSDFIQALYSTSSSYKESIGEILWFYGFAPKYGDISNDSLETLPTISWTANGSDDPSYPNNAFEIVFLDQYKLEILRISTTSMSYTLNGNVPGGSISSIGDDEVVDTMICVAMPTETNAKDEE